MALPLLFEPMKFNGDTVVDGGVIENYPLWVFNDTKALYTGKVFDIPRDHIRDDVVGFKLYNSDEKNTRKLFYGINETETFVEYLKALSNTLSTQVERNGTITGDYFSHTVPIQTYLYNDFESELDHKAIEGLITIGEQSVKNSDMFN
jgi:hypothetical protein